MKYLILAIVTFVLTSRCTVLDAQENVAKESEMTLEKAYQLALLQSEELGRREQDILIAEAQYKEVLGTIYPNIHLLASQRFRSSDQYGISDSGGGAVDEPGGGGTVQRSRRDDKEFQAAINVRQPIFTGFREFFVSQSLKSEAKALEHDRERAKQLLFLDVADVYSQILMFDGDIKILSDQSVVLSDRIVELGRFIDLGRSREGEIHAVESQLAEVASIRERTKGALQASKELLAFLVGLPATLLQLAEQRPIVQPLTLDDYLAQSVERHDIKASTARVYSGEKLVTAAEREKWPSISAEGNAYPYEDPDLNREWDAFVVFDLPIFEGGSINARIAQTRADLRSRQLTLQEVRRVAERDVRTAYSEMAASLSEVEALKKLVQASRKNTTSQIADYKLGLVTNLDVLDALRAEQESKRRLLLAETTLKTNQARLIVAAGGPN